MEGFLEGFRSILEAYCTWLGCQCVAQPLSFFSSWRIVEVISRSSMQMRSDWQSHDNMHRVRLDQVCRLGTLDLHVGRTMKGISYLSYLGNGRELVCGTFDVIMSHTGLVLMNILSVLRHQAWCNLWLGLPGSGSLPSTRRHAGLAVTYPSANISHAQLQSLVAAGCLAVPASPHSPSAAGRASPRESHRPPAAASTGLQVRMAV